MLETGTWQVVPGTGNVRLLPLLRKPSVSCSNSFILQTPEYIVIIDPGASETQVGRIGKIALQLLREKVRPVSIVLTHTHVDHFYEVPRLLAEPVRGALSCHVEGAAILRNRDEERTMANLYGRAVPECPVRAALFETVDNADGPTAPITRTFGVARRIPADANHSLCVQKVDLGGGECMEIFHTPGHTADGISIRVGNYLFAGDLPFATDVAVAGVAGWDPAALAGTYRTLRWIAQNRDLTHVLPGHGTVFPIERAERIFARGEKKLTKLTDIIPLDKARMARLREYAQAILDEAGTVFAIVGARVLKAAHYLEMLEEEDAARSLLTSIDFEAIDAVIGEFHSFVEKFKHNEDESLILLKAVQFVHKMKATFAPQKISRVIDRLLLRRIASLFEDFINAVRGVRFRNQEVAFDLYAAVAALLTSLKETPYDEDTIYDALHCEEMFAGELAVRFAYHPVFESVSFTFEPADGEAATAMEKGAFEDLLTSLLEELAALRASAIRIGCEHIEGHMVLAVRPDTAGERADIGEAKERYLRLALGNYGCRFRKSVEGDSIAYYFELPAAAEED